MKRSERQLTPRARTSTEGSGHGGTRLLGKVVLIDASDASESVQRAFRYAKEGADVALAYRIPCDEIFILQRQIEALGNRCVLYEIGLEDEWNCGLVLQSTIECLGALDLIVDRHGHVTVLDRNVPCTAAELLAAVGGRGALAPPTHTAA